MLECQYIHYVTFPMFPCFEFVYMICLCSFHHNFAACFVTMAISFSSCNTSVISLSVTSFPSSSFSFLKIFYISKFLIRSMLFFILIWSSSLIMPFVGFFAFNWCNKLITVIFLLNKITLLYFCCVEKELVCVAIAFLTGCQFFLCVECM